MVIQKSTTQIGDTGEELVVSYLKKQGYKIISRNYTIRGGDIDIIAIDDDVLVFVEVKSRFGREFGFAREAITYWKMKYLQKAALFYIQKIQWGKPYRFDLIAIDYDNHQKTSIELVRNIL